LDIEVYLKFGAWDLEIIETGEVNLICQMIIFIIDVALRMSLTSLTLHIGSFILKVFN